MVYFELAVPLYLSKIRIRPNWTSKQVLAVWQIPVLFPNTRQSHCESGRAPGRSQGPVTRLNTSACTRCKARGKSLSNRSTGTCASVPLYRRVVNAGPPIQYEYIRVRAIQVTLRLWNQKDGPNGKTAGAARQMTMIQEM